MLNKAILISRDDFKKIKKMSYDEQREEFGWFSYQLLIDVHKNLQEIAKKDGSCKQHKCARLPRNFEFYAVSKLDNPFDWTEIAVAVKALGRTPFVICEIIDDFVWSEAKQGRTGILAKYIRRAVKHGIAEFI